MPADMHTVKIIAMKTHRGAPRVWFEGSTPAKSGFEPGMKYSVNKDPDNKGVLIELCDDGRRTVSGKEYANGRMVPVLDLNSKADLGMFDGCQSVRAVFREGSVYISPVASEMRRVRRLQRLRDKLLAGRAISTAGVCAGGGILDHAVHSGLSDAGVSSYLAMHNEIREDLSNHVIENNDVFCEDSMLLQMPLQELAFDPAVMSRIGEIDVVSLGLPCSGASVAGRAKRALRVPEEHPDVGHLVVAALALIAKLNPVACIFENVPLYASSVSAVLIRQQLHDFGYDTHEIEVFGPDFGELEARKRWCLAAVTKGIDFDFKTLVPQPFAVRQLSEVLETGDAVEGRWSQMTGLKAKQVRDIEAGKGFLMQTYTGEESRINTLTKGIAKNRSTDPKIVHPENPELLRMPTAVEHARCKGVPEHLIAGLSQTTAHELLGQGIVYKPFRQVAKHLGAALKRFAMAGVGVIGATRIEPLRAAA